MRKDILIALIAENLSGGDAPAQIRGKYDNRVIEKFLDIVYNDVIYALYEQGVKTDDYSMLDSFGKSYKLKLKQDEDREEYYVELPVSAIPLPDNRGIRLVSPFKNQSGAFDYRDNNSNHVWNVLFVDVVRNTPSFYVEVPRIYIQNFTKGLEDIMVKAIPPYEGLSEQDDVFVPGGNNSIIFERVHNLMLGKNQTPKVDYVGFNSKQI